MQTSVGVQGFRRYQPIRDTLIHELAHNVWSDHDNRFKALNSQLQKEVAQIDRIRRGGPPLPRPPGLIPWLLCWIIGSHPVTSVQPLRNRISRVVHIPCPSHLTPSMRR